MSVVAQAHGRVEASVSTQARAVQSLNDTLRRSFIGGRVVMTSGVAALPEPERAAVLAAMRGSTACDADNDLHGEHDFGAVEFGSEASGAFEGSTT